MGSWASGIILRVLAAILCVVALVWLALWYFIPAPPSAITIAAGIKGGAFEHIAKSYRERLARHHVRLDLRLTDGALSSLKLVEERNSGVDAAFVFGGVSDAARSPDLVSLGRIGVTPIWFFYRGPEKLERLAQLKGKRIGANLDFPPVKQILNASGINATSATLLQRTGPVAVKSLKDGEVDVIVVLADPNSPPPQSLLRDPAIRIMSLTQAEALARVFPYLNRLVLPQGVIDFENNIPANDVTLIATTGVVVARKTLHPELVFLLAQTIQEEHSGVGIFQRVGEFPTQTDPEFPVAEEARDFYRNGPSFLQRYLPFWMINYTKRVAAILVAAIAIVIPMFSFAPRLYAWFLQKYMEKLYRRLRIVEASLQTDLTVNDVEGLQTNLENISRAAHILPMRHSSLFFDLIMHIRLTRTELASRLATLRG